MKKYKPLSNRGNLTIKQQRFADGFITTGNATQSYIDAGYSVKQRNTAEVNASILLRNHKVIQYIDKVNSDLEGDRIAGMEEVKEFWTNTMRSPIVERKDRIKASELIAKTNGAFIERIEHTGNLNINNPFDELTPDELRRLAGIDE